MLKPRLLLIEDADHRIQTFTRWLQGSDFVLVVCRSGGQAKGMLTHGGAEVIAGVLLDHDLTDARITEADHHLSSTDVLPLLATRLHRWTPILIHSHNPVQAPKMHRALATAGMEVTQVPFSDLVSEAFDQWLMTVRDHWDDVACELSGKG